MKTTTTTHNYKLHTIPTLQTRTLKRNEKQKQEKTTTTTTIRAYFFNNKY